MGFMHVAKGISIQNSLNAQQDRNVSKWLLAGVCMVMIQIALGGITRLTGSGLSITEWDVVTGSFPPMSNAAWLEKFKEYQATPQFQLLNSDFGLSDFKFIFFWEWFHRLWARLIGLVFAGGFIYFLYTKQFRQNVIRPLIVLFLLGGMQGAIGWIMVASGLVGDAVYVRPTRLALHFIFALGLLAYTFWFYLQLRIPVEKSSRNKSINRFSMVMLALLVVQLLYGALMAGHKAASAAGTWPDINGSVLNPAGLFQSSHGWLNFIDNKIMIHFMHRGIAYLLLGMGLYLTWKMAKSSGPGSRLYQSRFLPSIVLFLQVILGIFSVLSSHQIVPNQWGLFEWMAQLHQLTGMLFLLVLIYIIFITKGPALSNLKLT